MPAVRSHSSSKRTATTAATTTATSEGSRHRKEKTPPPSVPSRKSGGRNAFVSAISRSPPPAAAAAAAAIRSADGVKIKEEEEVPFFDEQLHGDGTPSNPFSRTLRSKPNQSGCIHCPTPFCACKRMELMLEETFSSLPLKRKTEVAGSKELCAKSILPNFVSWMVEILDIRPEDTFYDLGSGNGSVLFQVALMTGAKCIGVEISKQNAELSQAAWEHILPDLQKAQKAMLSETVKQEKKESSRSRSSKTEAAAEGSSTHPVEGAAAITAAAGRKHQKKRAKSASSASAGARTATAVPPSPSLSSADAVAPIAPVAGFHAYPRVAPQPLTKDNVTIIQGDITEFITRPEFGATGKTVIWTANLLLPRMISHFMAERFRLLPEGSRILCFDDLYPHNRSVAKIRDPEAFALFEMKDYIWMPESVEWTYETGKFYYHRRV